MSRARRSRIGWASAIALLLVGAGLSSASASDIGDEGLWYRDALGIPELHADGVTGQGVTVAVIDNPINVDLPTLQGANIEVQESFCQDSSGNPRPGTTTDAELGAHGTNVVSLIAGTGEGYPGQSGVAGVAPGARVLTYADFIADQATCYLDGVDVSENSTVLGLSIADAVEQGADIISVSMKGGGYGELEEPIAAALREGVIVVAALSNGPDPTISFLDNIDGPPATMNGVVSVLASGPDAALKLDGYGDPYTSEVVDVVGPGVDILANGYPGPEWQTQQLESGTSFATPIVAGTLALAMDKYPDATPNQILQSMIHNTGTDGSHEPQWAEDYGYGTVVAQTLLAADPTQYDDVNPFIAEDWPFGGPRIAQIFGEDYQLPSATPSPSPTPDNEPTDEPNTSDDDNSSLLPIILIAAVVLILVVGAIITIAVITSRKSQKGADHGQV